MKTRTTAFIMALLFGSYWPVKAQDETKATYTYKINKENGYINPEDPPDKESVDHLIRAYYPWPTVWTKWKMKDASEKIIKLLPNGKIQLEGKNPVSIKDFLNGYPGLKHILEKLQVL